MFFPDASRRSPVAVVHPRTVQDVASVMKIAAESGGRVTVRGGGLGYTCVDDSALLIDLSVHLGQRGTDRASWVWRAWG